MYLDVHQSAFTPYRAYAAQGLAAYAVFVLTYSFWTVWLMGVHYCLDRHKSTVSY